MTFQPPPPPPPPGGTPPPPPPPPGQWGPPPAQGGGYPAPGQGGNYPAPGPGGNYPAPGPGGPGYGSKPAFDPKTVNPLDWAIVGAGVLAFLFSLFDYYTVSVSVRGFGGSSASASAWHGFFGWFAALLALAGAAVVAIELFAPQVKLPIAARLAGLGLFAVATLCVIIALFVFPGDTTTLSGPGYSVDEGHGFGYWISLIVIIAGTVLSLMRLQATGGTLPGALSGMPNIGHYGPQGGNPQSPQGGYGQGGTPPPPPPGYGPPR